MHTILGANGTIACDLSRGPATFPSDIRQVSRNPRKFDPNDETLAADLLEVRSTAKAESVSEVVYLVALGPKEGALS